MKPHPIRTFRFRNLWRRLLAKRPVSECGICGHVVEAFDYDGKFWIYHCERCRKSWGE
jgi:hypothetical protein